MTVFLLFLLALILGTASTLYWVPGDDLGRGYFQMNALIILGLLSLTVTLVWLHPMRPFASHERLATVLLAGAVVASFVYYAAIWKEAWLSASIPLSGALVAILALLLMAGRTVVQPVAPLPHRSGLLVACLVSSALIVGWSLVTMLLGHWYLIVPKLAFRHLITFCWILVAVILARWIAVGATLAVTTLVDPYSEPHPWRLLVDLNRQGMFFWFRLLWGLAMPLLLSILALHCARNRSNQSATGILYVVVVGCIIGEITALYLTVTTGVPV